MKTNSKIRYIKDIVEDYYKVEINSTKRTLTHTSAKWCFINAINLLIPIKEDLRLKANLDIGRLWLAEMLNLREEQIRYYFRSYKPTKKALEDFNFLKPFIEKIINEDATKSQIQELILGAKLTQLLALGEEIKRFSLSILKEGS